MAKSPPLLNLKEKMAELAKQPEAPQDPLYELLSTTGPVQLVTENRQRATDDADLVAYNGQREPETVQLVTLNEPRTPDDVGAVAHNGKRATDYGDLMMHTSPRAPDNAKRTTHNLPGEIDNALVTKGNGKRGPENVQGAARKGSRATGTAQGTTYNVSRKPGGVHRAQVEDAPMRPDGAIARVRYERPHVSVYAHPAVFDVFREIAYRERRKAHELYLEAFAMLLDKYGYDFNELNGR